MDIWSKSTVEVVVVVVTSQMVRNKVVGAGSCLNIAESIPSGFWANTIQARI